MKHIIAKKHQEAKIFCKEQNTLLVLSVFSKCFSIKCSYNLLEVLLETFDGWHTVPIKEMYAHNSH